MEIKAWDERPGPAPVRTGSHGAALSGERAVVLERLQRSGRALTISELAAELTAHPNTVREHLDALVERKLATRERAPSRGRGRPPWQYTAAVDLVEPDVRVRDYAGLAAVLAGHLERTAADPAAEGLAVGRDWGRELAGTGNTSQPADADAAAAARRRVLGLLEELGFAPAADALATTAALRRCPLLDVARAHPEVVCSVHLGIVRGALDVYGGEPEATALIPFAEPGACRLHLVPAAGPDV